MDTAHTRSGASVQRPGDRNLAGTTLGGRYAVLELLGAGGMGAVYRAHDRELDEMVALKVIRADHASRAGMVEQFRHEVKLARRVTHVNIARTFELVAADGVMFCTMELVEGESLRARLLREGAMSVAEAVGVAQALCAGLAVAHAAGVIHRDIKPDNVLLTDSGRVVLADFGVAAFGAAEADGSLVGTLEYMAPEQARGEQATPASDVYAVGVVLFEMLTGLRAFAGTMSELIVGKQDVERLSLDFAAAVAREPISAELAEIVGQATARDTAERIASAQELARRLEPWRAAAIAGNAGAKSDYTLAVTEGREALPSLATVVVLAPRGNAGSRVHVAEGVHQKVLRRLAAMPRLRVWPRTELIEAPNATFVEFRVGEMLEVKIRREDIVSTLQLPLEIANIEVAAAAIAVAVGEVIGQRPDAEENARLELLLKARGLARRGFGGVGPAFELLNDGHERWPDEPRIAADLATLILRYTFAPAVQASKLAANFARVKELVAAALRGAPDLAESHVAAGHLQLYLGDPVIAAREFRTAIALSPYEPEPHEGLGRLLLEAGFLDDAVSRLDDALAIAPVLSSVRWEIARAHALEQNWMVHDRMIAALRLEGDRPAARFRYALWRGDRAGMVDARDAWKRIPNAFEPQLIGLMFSVVIDGTWNRFREKALEIVTTSGMESKRSNSFVSQMLAEIAGHAGDVEVCLMMLRRSVQLDMFDRHWFDRCPSIAEARSTPDGTHLHQVVTQRAGAILDALYGDVGSSSDTIIG